MKKANTFYEIQDAVAFNNPIDNDDNAEFYTDFSKFRKGFHENKIFKFLNINPQTNKCNKLSQTKKIFLSGHRGTGKTTELLKIKNTIDATKCYLTIFCDIADEELDVNNVDVVDIIILMLEKLIYTLEDENIDLPIENIESFYNWYKELIVEINAKTDESAIIDIDEKTTVSIGSFILLVKKTKWKLSGTNSTKKIIRETFINKFSDFSIKFNQFLLDINAYLKIGNKAENILFILDGFEKIGSLEDRKKILIDNSNRFIDIKANMIITLPIELFSQAIKLNEFAKSISFPLVSLDDDSKIKFREFIYRRIDASLFENERVVDRIIEYGAGSPRETLKIILNAFYEAEEDLLNMQSVEDAQKMMSDIIVRYLQKEEVELLKKIDKNENITFNDTLANLLVKKIVLEYGDSENRKINPILLANKDFNKHLSKRETTKRQKEIIAKEDISTIKEISIEKFFSIGELNLTNLNEKKEIYIVGENGDGKTLVLQAIALALKGVKEGRIVDFLKSQNIYTLKVTNNGSKIYNTKNDKPYRNLFAYGAHRNNNCKNEDEETGYLTLFDNSLDLKDPKKWLIELYNAEKSEEPNILSVEGAKELLKDLLRDDIEINITYNDVEFKEKNASVSFEQLSAGYKGVITIIGDLLVRLSKNQPYITDTANYKGIVLIDEVELHLHPKWKYNFMEKLRKIFPEIQFIVTTHSPTVILGANKEAVFYKVYKDKDGKVNISGQTRNIGYTNNSLISSPLFDLDTMASRDFDNKNFSDDNYIYSNIHKVVAQNIEKDKDLSEDDILKIIEDELDKL